MSYTPTEWKNGDTITAEKLNKIEEGIENNSTFNGLDLLIEVTLTDGNYVAEVKSGNISTVYEKVRNNQYVNIIAYINYTSYGHVQDIFHLYGYTLYSNAPDELLLSFIQRIPAYGSGQAVDNQIQLYAYSSGELAVTYVSEF